MKNRRSKIITFFLFLSLLFVPSLTMTSCSTVNISEKSISLYVDETYDLNARSSDEDALVLWESSNNNVAVVRRGKVTARGKGECEITAYDDNGARASCRVIVDAMNIKISHVSKQVDLHYLKTFMLSAECEDGGDVTWSSNDETLASVSQSGLVTCKDAGNVIISAYRKGGKANCSVSIIDSDRAEDYYEMQKAQNADVIANPGTWYYWPNGSSAVGKTVYQNKGFTSSITKLDSTGVAYRYQPGGEDGTGLQPGDRYSISFKIMLNVTTQIRGKKTMNVTANEWADYSYTGTVSTSEAKDPFNFSIRDTDIPSSGSITVAVKEIVVSVAHAADYYEIKSGNNATVVGNQGSWYYWANGTDTVSRAFYENSQVNISINKLTHSDGMYFRYQPGGKDNTGLSVGDSYTISLDITMNVAGKFTGKSSATVTTPGEFVKYTYSGVVEASTPFQITLKGVTIPSSGTIDVKMKNIVITNDTPPASGYTVVSGNNATVVANPGIWYYWTNGSGDNVSAARYNDDDGILSATITKIGSDQGIYFRYQPGGNDGTDFVAGDIYTISFKVTMSIAGLVEGKSSARVTTPGEFVTYTYKGEFLQNNQPFNFTLKKTGVTIPDGGKLDITVKEVTITGEDVPPSTEGIPSGDQNDAMANPGDWYVSSGSGDTISASSVTNNGLTLNVSALSSPEGITLYYQPGGKASNGLLLGDDYTVECNVKMNNIGTLGGSESINITTPDTNVALSHTDIINDSDVFTINLKNIEVPSTGDLILTISGMKFKSLGLGPKATVRANPGKWFYNSAGSASFNVVPRCSHDLTTGTLGVEIAQFNGDHFYFRYQPTYAAGTSYRVTLTVVATTNANIAYGNKDGSNGTVTEVVLTANEATSISFEATVSDLIFYVMINKNNSTPIGVTLSNIVVEAI